MKLKNVLKATLFTLFFVSTLLNADVYRWKDSRGITQYSDKAPASVINANRTAQNVLFNIVKNQNFCSSPLKSTSNQTLRPQSSLLLGNYKQVKEKLAQKIKQQANIKPSVLASTGSGIFTNLGKGTVSPQSPKGVQVATTIDKTPPQAILSNAPATPTVAATKASSLPVKYTQASATQSKAVEPSAESTTSNTSAKPNLMPTIASSSNLIGENGFDTLKIRPAKHDGVHKDKIGAFRTGCAFSHTSNDDPIVYPGVKGAAHHHSFFGNTKIDFNTNSENILKGATNCAGGSANLTGYWSPSIIDTSSKEPVKPTGFIVYYKSESTVSNKVVVPPKGLKMIAGNPKATNLSEMQTDNYKINAIFMCFNTKNGNISYEGNYLPNCMAGNVLRAKVKFPACWDGVNLDSPDHKSHMAYPFVIFRKPDGTWYHTPNNCPTSHPVAIPEVTINVDYAITNSAGTANWRLASDNYPSDQPGGYSIHADWMNGWDEKIMTRIVKNCINKSIDCGVNYLGDGEELY